MKVSFLTTTKGLRPIETISSQSLFPIIPLLCKTIGSLATKLHLTLSLYLESSFIIFPGLIPWLDMLYAKSASMPIALELKPELKTNTFPYALAACLALSYSSLIPGAREM